MNSINSPLSKFQEDQIKFINKKISKKQFLNKYGHLRPGTYDINAIRYDNDPSFLRDMKLINLKSSKNKFSKIKNVKKINDIINIISNQHNLDTKLIIVFSAFGNITDKLTNILDPTLNDKERSKLFIEIKNFHMNITNELCGNIKNISKMKKKMVFGLNGQKKERKLSRETL